MRLRPALSIVCACLALAACKSVPLDATPPAQASVAGSHVDSGDGRVDTFRVTEIDGHPIGRGEEPYKTLGIDTVNAIDATRSVHVEFEGLARYGNPLKTLMWDPRRVQGSVDFVPLAQTRYVVRGEIGPDGSTVWLENDATHEVVVRKFTAAPPPPTSAPERNL
jgi:hypothetical protein